MATNLIELVVYICIPVNRNGDPIACDDEWDHNIEQKRIVKIPKSQLEDVALFLFDHAKQQGGYIRDFSVSLVDTEEAR